MKHVKEHFKRSMLRDMFNVRIPQKTASNLLMKMFDFTRLFFT